MTPNPNSDASTDREIVITRIIDAPRQLVFQAFTAAEHLDQWFGPHGFTTTTQRFDFTAQRDEVVTRFGAIEAGQQTLGRLAAYVEAQKGR